MMADADLAAIHGPLLQYAKLRLRNDSMAEDVVSETMLALLEKPERFAGRSSLQTYATGILRFKIIDLLRRQRREVHVEPHDAQGIDDALDDLLTSHGHAADSPRVWLQPDMVLQQNQFFDALQTCVDQLPARICRAFTMRESLGKDTSDICLELGITRNNCSLMLHRARMRLRECLCHHWTEPP